jgi:hypothetical protein
VLVVNLCLCASKAQALGFVPIEALKEPERAMLVQRRAL